MAILGPISRSRATRPQTRESHDCARLSPRTKYCVLRDRTHRRRVTVTATRFDVRLREPAAVDEHHAAPDGDALTGEADDPVHERRPGRSAAARGGPRRQLVGDDVSALRVSHPVEHFRDGDPVGLVAEAARVPAVPGTVEGRLHRRGRDPVELGGDRGQDEEHAHDREHDQQEAEEPRHRLRIR